MREPLRSVIIGFISGAVAALLVVTVVGSSEPGPAAPVATTARGLDELRDRLASLEARVSNGAAPARALPQPAQETSTADVVVNEDFVATAGVANNVQGRLQDMMRNRAARTNERLREMGWTEAEIADLETLRVAARLQMEEQMFHQMRQVLEANPNAYAMMGGSTLFRKELGEERYEQYLRARGETRLAVPVRNVLAGSAGEAAGLQSGDAIRRYGSERVYNEQDLMLAILQGEFGESVTVEVERGGTVFYLTVPRGPLGTSGMSGAASFTIE